MNSIDNISKKFVIAPLESRVTLGSKFTVKRNKVEKYTDVTSPLQYLNHGDLNSTVVPELLPKPVGTKKMAPTDIETGNLSDPIDLNCDSFEEFQSHVDITSSISKISQNIAAMVDSRNDEVNKTAVSKSKRKDASSDSYDPEEQYMDNNL